MFNNSTTTFGSSSGYGAVVPTPAVTVPDTVFPGTTITTNSTFIIFGPPPPFPAPPRSIDLSPLKLIFAVIAIVAVPALVYALFFTVPCSSSSRRNSSSSRRSSSTTSSSNDVTVDITSPTTTVVSPPESGDKFQKEKHSKEIGNECTVCLYVITDGEKIRRLTCDHAFHVDCIEEWLQDHPNCPICRAEVPVKQQSTETAAAANVTTVNANRSGGNRRVSATNRDDDWRQGLPDASSLV
ncbi:PREDICTED: RING-H2 finger protein ATL33-like [Camelina sativa]|uniref:RING-H2 finger protein ATL33-like n=1 Tax=Camelina sativa TaxID=90675 RepID=A0ABM0YST3_CAMSA|nr:PREDICTED: RING-H2 finger protein ATL33-like [Camelina sativa]